MQRKHRRRLLTRTCGIKTVRSGSSLLHRETASACESSLYALACMCWLWLLEAQSLVAWALLVHGAPYPGGQWSRQKSASALLCVIFRHQDQQGSTGEDIHRRGAREWTASRPPHRHERRFQHAKHATPFSFWGGRQANHLFTVSIVNVTLSARRAGHPV